MDTFIAYVIGGLAGIAGILLGIAWDKYVIHKGWRGWHLG